MVIWGFRTMMHVLGIANTPCQQCQNPAAQRIERYRRWFTLFFIPLIPFSSTYVMNCTFCGCQSRLSREQAEALVGQSGHGAPGQPPAGPQMHPQATYAAPSQGQPYAGQPQGQWGGQPQGQWGDQPQGQAQWSGQPQWGAQPQGQPPAPPAPPAWGPPQR